MSQRRISDYFGSFRTRGDARGGTSRRGRGNYTSNGNRVGEQSSISVVASTAQSPATQEYRAEICVKVLCETPRVLATTPGGSDESKFYRRLLEAIQPPDTLFPPLRVSVIDGDTYSVAESILTHDLDREGKVAVLNLASEYRPGGGWRNGSLAQEETLCYRSTLYASLDKSGYYPLPLLGAIYSPGVVVHRKEMKDGFRRYENDTDRFVVGVVTLAGLRRPELNHTGDSFATQRLHDLLDNKIRQVLRVFALHGQEYIVLGALGCGAFGNPPQIVADTFKRILLEEEWRGLFKDIVFAVMAGNGRQHLVSSVVPDEKLINAGLGPGRRNYEIFKEILDGLQVG